MPLVDDFLLPYDVGQALLLVFAIAVLSIIARYKSRQMLAAGFLVYGLIFILTPPSLAPLHYKFLGFALLVLGPMIYVTSDS